MRSFTVQLLLVLRDDIRSDFRPHLHVVAGSSRYNGRGVMDDTILGHVLRICISQLDPSVVQALTGAEKRDQRSVENSLDAYRSMLTVVTGLGHELCKTLLMKGGKSKEETVRRTTPIVLVVVVQFSLR